VFSGPRAHVRAADENNDRIISSTRTRDNVSLRVREALQEIDEVVRRFEWRCVPDLNPTAV
jgi:hypothetical protein